MIDRFNYDILRDFLEDGLEKKTKILNLFNFLFVMADDNIDASKLPVDVRAKLAELELELSEGKT